MPLIAMNREMGSLGKDVARQLGEALGLKVRHHEVIDHLANRARVRKSHVLSFLEGSQGLLERFTVDELTLRAITADEVLSIASANGGVILRGWGATALLRDVPHAVRICVTAPRAVRVRRMMQRIDEDDPNEVARLVDQNDEAAGAVMRRHFKLDARDVSGYDVAFNTDRVSVAQCVDEILGLVKSASFAETEESIAKLRDIATVHRVRAALRTNLATAECRLQISAANRCVTLEGVVAGQAQRSTCVEIASACKDVNGVVNLLKAAELPLRMRGDG